MKCHWCNKELQEIQDNDNPIKMLECPDVHIHVVLELGTNDINSYTIFVDHNERRFKIVGNKEGKTTLFYVKKGPSHYSLVFNMKRYLVLKSNKDGILEAKSIFNKLKTLVIFS